MRLNNIFLLYLIVLKHVGAACTGHYDYEAVIGGYPLAHHTINLVFDHDPTTGDIVLGGRL